MPVGINKSRQKRLPRQVAVVGAINGQGYFSLKKS
jgi:hypothetical protein